MELKREKITASLKSCVMRRIVTLLFTKYYLVHQMEVKMGKSYSTCMRVDKWHMHKGLVGKTEGTSMLGRPRLILKKNIKMDFNQ
jgi:hypothetical protein